MASCITLQLGQCGTQIGHELFSQLYDDATSSQNSHYSASSLGTFFKETAGGKREARSVMVDMEPKVVTSSLGDVTGKGWRYTRGQQLCKKSGSGNNWSYGYLVHSPKCRDEIVEMIRREAERADHLGGFLVLMSLAGGTGSGLGSYVTGLLRELYPKNPILNSVVLPYSEGEVAVQNYNAVLSLAHMAVTSDANILYQNNHLHQVCNSLLGIKHASFKDLNRVVALQLASVLQPLAEPRGAVGRRNVINDIVYNMACSRDHKMLSIKSVPHIPPSSVEFTTYTWDSLARRVYQMMVTDHQFDDERLNWHEKLPSRNSLQRNHPRYVANMLTLRGMDAADFKLSDIADFNDNRLYPPWIPPHARSVTVKSNLQVGRYDKSLTLLSNGTSCVKPLDIVTGRAWKMFNAQAFLHQYAKYGLERDDFMSAFVAVEHVISSYKQL